MTFFSLIKISLAVFLSYYSVLIASQQNNQAAPISIEQFGARPNDPHFDNGPAIIKALQTAKTILFPAGRVFYISSTIQVTGLDGLKIVANGSTLINTNYDARTFLLINSSNVIITGGTFTRDVMPDRQDGKAQSTIGFQSCNNVTVNHVHISRSPEMGVDNNIVIGGIYADNTIDHCLRDGIYAHYSANLKYLRNNISFIKDDGLSMHDYGIDAQKAMLKQAGYQQAGHSVISGNHISNCVQGISSIGCTDVLISGNVIKNTVNAGICLFNSEDLYSGTNARVNNVKVLNNFLSNNGGPLNIDGFAIPATAQNSSGRAAIFIACIKQGADYTVSKMRLSGITVQGNTVNNSAVNGILLYNIDGVNFRDNKFINCNSGDNSQTGNIIEIQNCTAINVLNNTVTDNRNSVLHKRAYAIENSSGSFQKGIVAGYKTEAVSTRDSRLK